jgi:hypothetical protein
MTRRAELAPPCWAISGPWAIRATTYANSTACVIYFRRVARYAVPISRVATGGRDGFEPSVPRLRSLAEFVKPRSPPRPFRAGGVGRARAPSDSPRTKPSLPSRATFKISREDRDRSGQNSGREWDSLIKPETSLIADLNSLQGRIIFVRMRRELASNRFGIEVIPAFRGEKVSERVAAE